MAQFSEGTRTVPDSGKRAFLLPFIKRDQILRSLITGLGISKLFVISKVLEKFIYWMKSIYLLITRLALPNGYLRGRSTVSNLVLFSDFLTKSMDDGMQVNVIYTDYRGFWQDKSQSTTTNLKKLSKAGIRAICEDVSRPTLITALSMLQ